MSNRNIFLMRSVFSLLATTVYYSRFEDISLVTVTGDIKCKVSEKLSSRVGVVFVFCLFVFATDNGRFMEP